jgi:hypothetical protein
VENYLKEYGIMPYVMANDKFKTGAGVKFLEREINLESVKLVYEVTDSKTDAQGVIYLALNRAFIDGASIKIAFEKGKGQSHASLVTATELTGVASSHTQFVVKFWVSDLSETSVVKLIANTDKSGTISLNNNKIS